MLCVNCIHYTVDRKADEIALSQSNPLKAIAEFVENSIDANAKTITITRGREHGDHYLAIKDDGDGLPRDANGLPDFKYVATHKVPLCAFFDF